jgi:hypothetical protein
MRNWSALMLKNIRIACPCSADWEQMAGDNRIRHCYACNLNVYNFSAFSEAEIRELLENRKERVCGRLFQRHDGTVITQNCPVGLKKVVRRISRIAGAIFSLVVPSIGSAPAAFAQSYARTNVSSSGLSIEVIDPTGAVIPGATVVLTETTRNQTIHGTADKNGRVSLWAGLSGRYHLTVSAPYMQPCVREVDLRTGEVFSLQAKLLISGLVGEVVEIDPGSQPSRDSITPALVQPTVIGGSGSSPIRN